MSETERVLVAGATGAIGRPLIAALVESGYQVTALTHAERGVPALAAAGAEPVLADVLDAGAVERTMSLVRPHVIIDELTSLPPHYTPEAMSVAIPGDARLRLEGGLNLLSAARRAGAKRYLVQSSGYWYAPGPGLATETDPLAFDASPEIAAGTRRYATIERRLFEASDIEGVALRYGFFYGPGTWNAKDGDIADQVRARGIPIIGRGDGVWSYIHVKDAAAATVAALHAPAGVYNVVDDQPSRERDWLPAFARWVGAPPPETVADEELARQIAGADAVYSATRLRGASNAKAKRLLSFSPRRLEWLGAA